MGVHGLGKRRLRQLSRALGRTVYRAYLSGHDPNARCFVDRDTVALINYRTLEVVMPPTTEHTYGIGWFDDADKPPDPFLD
jgi:hypothetical protein